MKIDVLGIQAFLSITELGSFQQAAASLHLSQTALSHRLRKFEDDLGCQLLTRTTRQISLTPAGEHFLPKARHLLSEMHNSLEELRSVGGRKQQSITIGCLPTISSALLPEALKAFAVEFPDISVRVFDRIAPDLTEIVKSGEAEMAFTVASTFPPELEFKPLVKQHFVVLCPADHKLARLASIQASDLAGCSGIRLSPSDVARQLIDQALGSQGQLLDWRYEVQQMTTAIALVGAGLGVTIVPRLSVYTKHIPGVVAVALNKPQIDSIFGILTRRTATPSPAGDVIAGLIRKFVLVR